MRRNRKKVWMIISVLFILLLISPPFLDSKIHNYDSPRSAIRAYISDQGYPYQSFFAIIRSKDVYDETYGNKYDVIWNPWKNETGMIPTICYTKNKNEKYSVSCGTGPWLLIICGVDESEV